MESGGMLLSGVVNAVAAMPMMIAQEAGSMNLIDMWNQMGLVARIVAFILVFMSMWSFGVAIERYYTFSQARKQSKMYAPRWPSTSRKAG